MGKICHHAFYTDFACFSKKTSSHVGIDDANECQILSPLPVDGHRVRFDLDIVRNVPTGGRGEGTFPVVLGDLGKDSFIVDCVSAVLENVFNARLGLINVAPLTGIKFWLPQFSDDEVRCNRFTESACPSVSMG